MAQDKIFKENVDSWIKDLSYRLNGIELFPEIVQENTGNIQHNYELIHELRDEIECLKQSINALKIIQMNIMGEQNELKNEQIRLKRINQLIG